MKETLSLAETARHLQASEDFVATMVRKQRLTPRAGNRFDATEVEALAALLARLRSGGIATMVDVADQAPHKLHD